MTRPGSCHGARQPVTVLFGHRVAPILDRRRFAKEADAGWAGVLDLPLAGVGTQGRVGQRDASRRPRRGPLSAARLAYPARDLPQGRRRAESQFWPGMSASLGTPLSRGAAAG